MRDVNKWMLCLADPSVAGGLALGRMLDVYGAAGQHRFGARRRLV